MQIDIAYDGLSRMTQSVRDGGAPLDYHWDAAGSRKPEDGYQQSTFDAALNQYSVTPESVLVYDANGSMTGMPTLNHWFEWDGKDRLSARLIGETNTEDDFTQASLPGEYEDGTQDLGDWSLNNEELSAAPGTTSRILRTNPGDLQVFQFSYKSAHDPQASSLTNYAEAYFALEGPDVDGVFRYGAVSIYPDRLVIREWTNVSGAPALQNEFTVEGVSAQDQWYEVRLEFGGPGEYTVHWNEQGNTRVEVAAGTLAHGDGQFTYFVHDGAQVLAEHNGTTTTAEYVYGNYVDEPLQMQRGGNTYYYHQDDLFNVVALTDGTTGEVVEQYAYADYGAPTVIDTDGDTQQIGNPYRFTGRRFDAESAMYYYRTRYMDPEIGRFISRDTIGLWGDPNNLGNGQAYVGNNPWTLTDPYGEDALWSLPADNRASPRYRGGPDDLPSLNELHKRHVADPINEQWPDRNAFWAALFEEFAFVERPPTLDLVEPKNNIIYTGTQLVTLWSPIKYVRFARKTPILAEETAQHVGDAVRATRRFKQSRTSSTKLSRNLEQFYQSVNLGFSRPSGFEAHHIIPGGWKDLRAVRLRQMLTKHELDVNDAVNGLFLPGPSNKNFIELPSHRRIHTSDYLNELTRRFEGIDSRDEMVETLESVRQDLLNDQFLY